MICSDRMSENIFHGFSVRQLVTGNMLSFQFESMMSLNLFLVSLVSVEDAYLSVVRKKTIDKSCKLYSIKKRRKVIFPLSVKLQPSVDLEVLSQKFNFKVFTRINETSQEFASIDFCSKTDLYHFVFSEPIVFMFKTKMAHVPRSPQPPPRHRSRSPHYHGGSTSHHDNRYHDRDEHDAHKIPRDQRTPPKILPPRSSRSSKKSKTETVSSLHQQQF